MRLPKGQSFESHTNYSLNVSYHKMKEHNIIINLESNSYSLHSLEKLIEKTKDSVEVFEFHTCEEQSNENGLKVFRENNFENYDNIVSEFLIDFWSADISYIVRINYIWYFSLHSGANDYLGTGPSAVIDFRSFLREKGIKILARENLNDFLLKNFPDHPEVADIILDKYFTISESKIIKLLNKYKFEQTRIHFEESIDNNRNRNWASVNSQLRTFIESLFCEIAEYVTKQKCKTYSQAVKLLSNSSSPPFLKEELNEIASSKNSVSFLKGFWARLHPKGSHPGIPEIDDCIFRQQITMVTASHILNRLDKR